MMICAETNLDISSYGNELVKSSITVYNTVITQLLPTPTKCHYSFNLRDLSKVFQGMMMADILSIKVRRIELKLSVEIIISFTIII